MSFLHEDTLNTKNYFKVFFLTVLKPYGKGLGNISVWVEGHCVREYIAYGYASGTPLKFYTSEKTFVVGYKRPK